MKYQILTLPCLIPFLLNAQIGFREAHTDITNDFFSGAPVVSADINGDTYDDLVRLNDGTELCVDLLGGELSFFRLFEDRVSSNPEWNLISGDVNNDGWYDIVTSGISDRVKVLTASPFEGTFTRETIQDQGFFAQGSNLVDVNGDGYLDIFVCNDDALNRLYINNGDGTFERNDTLIDFATDPPSDNSGNYGSTWTDFDLDGDIDMYLSKCRVGVLDPTDPRRINLLYVNTDTGFVEAGAEYGLASGWQSWSSDIADIDNDGDFDIIVINHDAPAELFINDNGVYTDQAEAYGLDIRGVIIQSIFRDFDHDGWVDLLVSGSLPKLYHNNGGNGFTEVDAPFLEEFMSSFTLGDFNGDGFPDVYATYNDLYNTPSSDFEDKLWITVPTSNNYVRLKILGDGDKGGVGTKLFLYGPWGVQIREIRAGESYGIATSQIHTFGLGEEEAQSIDSLVVEWVDGRRDVIGQLRTNATHVLSPGGCATLVAPMEQGPFTQCGSDTFRLTVPEGYFEYTWNNGQTSEMIQVTEPGVYNVSMTDAQGCPVISMPVFVKPNTEVDSGEINVDGNLSGCYGDTITLTAPDGVVYSWNNGQTASSIQVTESGRYAVTVTRACLDAVPDPVEISLLNPADAGVENDTVLQIGSGTLVANGDSVLWFADRNSPAVIETGNTFVTPELDTTTSFFAQQFATLPGRNYEVGMTNHFGGSMYHSDNFNGALVFDAYDVFTLDSVWVITDFPGLRELVLRDGSFSVIHRMEVQIDSGAQWLPIGLKIEPGENYILTTDDGQNQQSFGTLSPKLWRSEILVAYPYIIDDVVRISRSSVGQGQYYYFYNWQITTEPSICEGERVAVTLVVEDTTSSVLSPNVLPLTLYPNPADQAVVLRMNDINVENVSYGLYDVQGRLMTSGIVGASREIDVSALSAGTYVIRANTTEGVAVGRFVVMRR